MKKWNFWVFTILMIGLLMAGVALAANVPNDQPDSSSYVGWGWNGYMPAFKDANGVSIPFLPIGTRPPIGYQGDFYVDEFSDVKIKQAWQELKKKFLSKPGKFWIVCLVAWNFGLLARWTPKGWLTVMMI
jgi:hypothetical protein